ncbi:MAG: hypothetical protein LWX83_17225, partial [Anaerolineae bacterium]|nr:hypothetical protein [Anaerolineae bacterium]
MTNFFDQFIKKNWLPYLVIMLGPLLLLSYPLLSGSSLFWGTPALQFIPWRTYAFEQILNGQMPFLNAYVGLNAPLIANYQLAFFYPFTWLIFPFFVLGGAPWLAWAHTLLVLIHLWLAGLGMAVLIKQWGGNVTGMMVGGLVFSLSGYWVTRLGFFSIISCGAWLPWELVFVNQILQSINQSKSPFQSQLWLCICVAMQLLAGHAQITFYSLILALAWGLVALFNGRQIKSFITNYLLIVIPVLLGSLLACIQLIPTAEYLILSQRSNSVDYMRALSYSFWPWHFVNFLTPNLFGS